jgi:hypothetical protein
VQELLHQHEIAQQKGYSLGEAFANHGELPHQDMEAIMAMRKLSTLLTESNASIEMLSRDATSSLRLCWWRENDLKGLMPDPVPPSTSACNACIRWAEMTEQERLLEKKIASTLPEVQVLAVAQACAIPCVDDIGSSTVEYKRFEEWYVGLEGSVELVREQPPQQRKCFARFELERARLDAELRCMQSKRARCSLYDEQMSVHP